jgi:hypothetical protein
MNIHRRLYVQNLYFVSTFYHGFEIWGHSDKDFETAELNLKNYIFRMENALDFDKDYFI